MKERKRRQWCGRGPGGFVEGLELVNDNVKIPGRRSLDCCGGLGGCFGK